MLNGWQLACQPWLDINFHGATDTSSTSRSDIRTDLKGAKLIENFVQNFELFADGTARSELEGILSVQSCMPQCVIEAYDEKDIQKKPNDYVFATIATMNQLL